MKLILTVLFAAVGLAAQVHLVVTVDGQTTSVTLPKAAGDAMAQFVAASDGKFASVAALIIKHLEESLAAVLIQRYPSGDVRAAQEAVEVAKAAVVTKAAAAARATVAPVSVVESEVAAPAVRR